MISRSISVLLWPAVLFFTGCAALFGWDIHAPGLLSESFLHTVQPRSEIVGLYVPPGLEGYEVRDRGSKFADPQTFYVGESLKPMLIEAFQQAFPDFYFLEMEPDENILRHYRMDYLVVVNIREFKNKVDLKSQTLQLVLTGQIFDRDFQTYAQFEARGVSQASRVFAKKGGPEVNLNAAIENALLALVQFTQERISETKQDPS